MFKIGNDLIEAYTGFYEDHYMDEYRGEFPGRNPSGDEYNEWAINRATQQIINNTPEQRLKIYLEWNGIIGYSNRIYKLATGHLF